MEEKPIDFDRVYALMEEMRKSLSTYRYVHSVGVAFMSADLAAVYGVDKEKALIAGILHDCAKEVAKGPDIVRICDDYGIALSDIERRATSLVHARLGAYYVKHKYGIDNQDIINAVDNHTVGRPAMSRLEQIVFCADFLDPSRNYACDPSLDELRRLIFVDIDMATYLILDNQISFFREKPRDIDTKTIKTYEFYKKIIEDREE